MTIEIQPINEEFGAEVTGVDLRNPLSEEDLLALKEAWSRHIVLVFRGQELSPEEFVRFGGYFGELWPHPVKEPLIPEHPEIYVLANILEDQSDHQPPQADFWHTDITYTSRPSRAGILYAKEVPATGGDTLFANMRRAFATLPSEIREKLLGLRTVHGLEGFAQRYAQATGNAPPQGTEDTREKKKQMPNVVHPAVISHPETGIPTLFVNPGFAIRFEGLSDTESRQLIDEITAHATAADNIYRHQWQKHDIVMWDNFSTMHKATGGYEPPMRRVMHRLTVGGYDLEPAIST